MQKRLEEMMKTVQPNKKFGEVIELKTDLHFLEAIEKEDKSCTVIILIHEDEEIVNFQLLQFFLGISFELISFKLTL